MPINLPLIFSCFIDVLPLCSSSLLRCTLLSVASTETFSEFSIEDLKWILSFISFIKAASEVSILYSCLLNTSSRMEFCPTCANLLQYEMTNPARFFCRSCRYISPIERKVKIKRGVQLTNKEATPIAVGKKPVGAATDATCPKCGHGRAEFYQMQTRSADEPMTIIYKCLKEGCRHNWRED